MSTQPISGGQRYSIGTIGTNVVCNAPSVVERVYYGGTYVGTVVIHDAATAAGTSGTSAILTIGIPLAQYPNHINLGVQCKYGIVTEATGTPVLNIVWNK